MIKLLQSGIGWHDYETLEFIKNTFNLNDKTKRSLYKTILQKTQTQLEEVNKNDLMGLIGRSYKTLKQS